MKHSSFFGDWNPESDMPTTKKMSLDHAFLGEKKANKSGRFGFLMVQSILGKDEEHQRLQQILRKVISKRAFIRCSSTAVALPRGLTAVFVTNKPDCNRNHIIYPCWKTVAQQEGIKSECQWNTPARWWKVTEISHGILRQGSTQREPWEALRQPLVRLQMLDRKSVV